MTTEKNYVRNYIVSNYDSLKYHKLTTMFATSPYNFSEPFNGCTEGLYIRESLHFNQIVSKIGAVQPEDFDLLETPTGAVVIFLRND